jgi:hypothetical protein
LIKVGIVVWSLCFGVTAMGLFAVFVSYHSNFSCKKRKDCIRWIGRRQKQNGSRVIQGLYKRAIDLRVITMDIREILGIDHNRDKRGWRLENEVALQRNKDSSMSNDGECQTSGSKFSIRNIVLGEQGVMIVAWTPKAKSIEHEKVHCYRRKPCSRVLSSDPANCDSGEVHGFPYTYPPRGKRSLRNWKDENLAFGEIRNHFR